MFLSQRIAKDPNFMYEGQGSKLLAKRMGGKSLLFKVRQAILESTKFIVNEDILPPVFDPSEKNTLSGDERKTAIRQYLSTWASDVVTGEDDPISFAKMLPTWLNYAKLPFKSIFIENANAGILIQDNPEWIVKDEDYSIYITAIEVASDGFLQPVEYLIRVTKEGDSLHPIMLPLVDAKGYPEDEMTEVIKMIHGIPALAGRAALITILIMTFLMFVNTANITQHKMSLSKKELKNVPPMQRESYVYKVLDIYRERKSYVNPEDVLHWTRERRDVKSHRVRGHFKKKNGKLFWWNAHWRYRENQSTVGVVEKDYRVN